MNTKQKKSSKPDFYIERIGRRKTAVARVRLYPNKKIRSGTKNAFHIMINEKPYSEFIALPKLRKEVVAPFVATDLNFEISVQVKGGGITAQAEAIRLGIARCLTEFKPKLRSKLKALGYLKRDPRMVERKKPGLRKARRPQQWRKR